MSAEAITNPAAEWAIVAAMLADPKLIGEVVGTQLSADDFIRADAKLLYATAVERYYSESVVEPLAVVEPLRPRLSVLWGVPEQQVPDALLERMRDRDYGMGVLEHAGIVRRLSTARSLLSVCETAVSAIGLGERTPEEIAGQLSTDALAATSGAVARTELSDWMDLGRDYVTFLQRQRLARAEGIELAVYTGMGFIDEYTKGIAPGELCFMAGAPGSGKSILGWKAAEGFAARQMKKPEDERVATLVVSMEMGNVPSATRLAQSITGLDGMRLREGDISDREYQLILREWKARKDLPIHFNFASNFRLSQLRALIAEAIRRHNVGFVILDHFRQIDTDKYVRDPNDRDEQKARFLKESICKDQNVAMLCIAHIVKLGGSDPNRRPRLDDLRGSGTIGANADFVGLLHRPAKNLAPEEQMALSMDEKDAELIWAKARFTSDGTAHLSIDAARMAVRSR